MAASLAIDEANARGGWRGVPFQLIPRWSENVWGTGVSQVARMVYDDNVWAILGSVDGPTTHLAEQVVAKARLPLVSPVSTDESVNLAGVPWMFSLVPADHIWAPLLAERLAARAADGQFALIAATDHDSRLAAEALLDELALLDRSPAYRLDLRPETLNPAEAIATLEPQELRALLLVAGPEHGARLLRVIRDRGFDGPIFAPPALARRRFLELAGNTADGLQVPLLLGSSPAKHADFARRFRERTGGDPDWAALHTYDAAQLLVAAVRRAGASRAGIRQALVELSPWQGTTGVIDWDPTGQNQRPVTAVGTIRDGRLVAE